MQVSGMHESCRSADFRMDLSVCNFDFRKNFIPMVYALFACYYKLTANSPVSSSTTLTIQHEHRIQDSFTTKKESQN